MQEPALIQLPPWVPDGEVRGGHCITQDFAAALVLYVPAKPWCPYISELEGTGLAEEWDISREKGFPVW